MELVLLKVAAFVAQNFAGVIQPILEDLINKDIHDDLAQVLSSIIVSIIVGFLIAYPQMVHGVGMWIVAENAVKFLIESQIVFFILWKKHPLREKLNRILYGPRPNSG